MEIDNIPYLLRGYDIALFGSFIVAILIIISGRLHLRYSSRSSVKKEIQTSHAKPTPRIGGLAVLAGCMFVWFISRNEARDVLGLIIFSSLPVLIFGLLDDFYFKIPPIFRLAAGALSSILAIVFLETWLVRVDVIGLDQLFYFAPFAIFFTVFATTGVSHAFNVIDGLHGLSLGVSLSVSFFITVLAWVTADIFIVLLSMVFFLSTLGLFILNYPWGKIFLGDGGAYFQGHCLSWIGILLISRNSDITAWAVLLIFFWPVVETLYSIFRRVYKRISSSKADRAHFHQLVYDKVKTLRIFRARSNLANAFSTFLLIPLFIIPSIMSLIFFNEARGAFITFLFLFLMYMISYNLIKPKV